MSCREKKINRKDLEVIEAQRATLATLRKAHLSASSAQDSIVQISHAPRVTISDRYYEIESLVSDYLDS